ncbi:short-chain fatty acyl-CoA regulator family protein [Roseinatronobacter sp.]|uniref:helix-turn-helix domain-containing protein n=1 Tax=Roseinatronobacter sp. TaxID=1945755 RepID=UPI0025FB7487|nr:helix-turn-helix transcriptional regulator [Rhodobaca sp.]
MRKTFIGPHLRRLRQEAGETQVSMAKRLGVSAAYVNLLENNQRSVSVAILLRLFEQYGVDWHDISEDGAGARLADLRGALQDPLFDDTRPDLHELRAAQTHAPTLMEAFLHLHRAYLSASDQLLALAAQPGEVGPIFSASPEGAVHNFFRRQRNYFPTLEQAADGVWEDGAPAPDDMYSALKARLRDRHGIQVKVVRVHDLPRTLRHYEQGRAQVLLSEALDHPNRVFQLVHVLGLIECRDKIEALLHISGIDDIQGRARCLVELANYFAAAVLMPYDAFLKEARSSKYDFDHLATRFGISFEQACHRATTMQREGAQGVPFFFLRLDKAGNVTKRFNATDFHLAEYGGACPKLDVHMTFRLPGRIVPQLVEMPDASQYFVFARTVDRPTFERYGQDNRLAVAMGCTIQHAPEIGYAEGIALHGAAATPIGINCRICPRAGCDQRAYQASVLKTPVDESRRGATRYDT